jgi:hypothetical protein
LFPTHGDKLIDLIRSTPGTELVFVDPLDDYLAGSVEENHNLPIRRVLQCFTAAAEVTGVAIVVIRHPGKDPNNLLAASRAFSNHPRAILRFDLVQDAKNLGILQPHKPPLGRWSLPRYYELAGGDDEPKRFTLRDLVEPGRATEAVEVTDRIERSKIDQAAVLLRRLLAGGKEMESADVYKAAEAHRLKERTVRYAAERVGVVKRWEGHRESTRCHWSLPIKK